MALPAINEEKEAQCGVEVKISEGDFAIKVESKLMEEFSLFYVGQDEERLQLTIGPSTI